MSSHTKKERTHILYGINCVHCAHSKRIHLYIFAVAAAAAAASALL